MTRLAQTATAARTFVDLVRARVADHPERTAFTFLADGERVEGALSYAQLDAKARSLAAALHERVASGRRVLIACPPGLDYVVAWLGAAYASRVAVPFFLPRSQQRDSRLSAVWRDAQPAAVLTTVAGRRRLLDSAEEDDAIGAERLLAIDDLDDMADAWRPVSTTANSLVMIQYTSGSSADPKGVAITHANLLASQSRIQEAFATGEGDVIVGWLPLFHDMGLVGNVLHTLYIGASCILMAPTAVLQSPARWLDAVAAHRATISGGPNFAFDMCVQRIGEEQRRALDLSAWRVAFNGAEPVRAETLERFAAAFAPSGFRRDAFRPCYGLAEATLLVTGRAGDEVPVLGAAARQSGKRDSLDVGCGAILDDSLCIVDPESRLGQPAGVAGEIWVRGPHVARGYWRRPAATAGTFHAQRLDDRRRRRYLRTGDIGYIRDGQLFVSGRLKDTIIIRGTNHHAEDIEWTVQRSDSRVAGRPGAAYAVSGDAGEELVIVQEVDARSPNDVDGLVDRMRAAVAAEHQVSASRVALVRPGEIPRTTSGKIRRSACRAELAAGRLTIVSEGSAPPPVDHGADPTAPRVQAWLRGHLAARLRRSPLEIADDVPIAHYGVDSLLAFEFAYEIERRYGCRIDAEQLLDNPTVRKMAGWIAEGRDLAVATVDVAPPSSDWPASDGQQALWMLWQAAPESGAYNLAAAGAFAGHRAETLADAFGAIVSRHASLRTAFSVEDGQLVQRVHDRLEGWCTTVDAGDWNDDAIAAYVSRAVDEPFDLQAPPLLRLHLLTRAGPVTTVLLVVHHAIADGWSLSVILQDLCRRCAGGDLQSEPPTPVEFADYVRWQRALLDGPAGEQLFDYWRAQLADAPALDLSALGTTRTTGRTYRGASRTAVLPPAATANLKAFAASSGVTVHSATLAAVQLLLQQYSGQDDVVVGLPLAGRPDRRWERVVGYFVNGVALRTRIAMHDTVEALVHSTHERVRSAIAHQHYPYARLASRLGRGDANQAPLFNVWFAYHNMPAARGLAALSTSHGGEPIEVEGVRFESVAVARRAAAFELSIVVADVGDRLLVEAVYERDRFAAAPIERMLGQLLSLLTGLGSHSATPVREVPLLSEAERAQIVHGWNATRVDRAGSQPVHRAFERQAALTPARVAVAFENRCLTYQELDRRSAQLAHRLRAAGIGLDARVAVCVEPSLDLVIGLMGVLKAGAAYVPLDPSYPVARLHQMLADVEAGALIVDDRTRPRFASASLPVLDAQEGAAVAAMAAPATSLPDGLAYVIYTSGSTGRPKGAMNTHAALTNRLDWMQEAFGLTEDDAVLQKTSCGFDVSVWEFFWPLITGARLVVARSGGNGDPLYIARTIVEQQITTVHFVPSVLQLFVEAYRVGECRSLRRVICSGEALSPALRDRFHARSTAALHNLYGPTEAAIDVTWWPCRRDDDRDVVPIGRPIANTSMYVLGRHGQPVPIGARGELCIGGIGLARGYFNLPGLTAQRFVPDPFAGVAGARMYRTGDVGRHLADGAIEYLGRLDHQVKLRGHRIELGEIERVLGSHPDVAMAAVLLTDEDGGPELRAYVALRDGVTESARELRSFLGAELPVVMVPAKFAFVRELPLTASGKIDRRALADVPAEEHTPESDAPQTILEQLVALVWRQYLHVAQIGVDDDFFALGGHSLMAAQIAMTLHSWFPTEEPMLMLLLQNPTVGRLAAAIEASPAARTEVAATADLLAQVAGMPADPATAGPVGDR